MTPLVVDQQLRHAVREAVRQMRPSPPNRWLDDPVGWVNRRAGEFVWSAQRRILRSVAANRYTAVPSAHDLGKSFVASRAGTWWMDVHPVGDAFLVSTAPTAAQVSAILWREIGRAHRASGLAGRILTAGYPQWKIDGELVGYGRRPADYDQAAFQGIHSLFPLIIIDEAGGVPKSLFDAVDALATNEDAHVLAIGNPDDPTSHFAAVCKPNSGWNVIQLDGLRSPNMTVQACEQYPLLAEILADAGVQPSTEEIPERLRRLLISALWVVERAQRWGVGSQLWQAKVRGVFPDTSIQSVIPLGWVEAAIARWREWNTAGRPEKPGVRIFGVDVADEGDDLTCIAPRQGDIVYELETFSHMDTVETTNQLVQRLVYATWQVVVDSVGIGAGVLHQLRHLGKPVVPFVAQKATSRLDSTGEFRFTNTRSAAWWNLRELLDPSRSATLMLPPDDEMKADLTTPRWKNRTGNIIAIESKDDIRKRLGRSTDRGDAVVQACWLSGTPVSTPDGSDGVFAWEDEPDPTGGVVGWQ